MGEGCASREKLAVLQSWKLSKVRKDYPAGAELCHQRYPNGCQLATSRETHREFQPWTQLTGKSLFNPEFLRIRGRPGHGMCVCAYMCVHSLACIINPSPLYTHSPSWLWHICVPTNMPVPVLDTLHMQVPPNTYSLPSLCEHRKHRGCTPPPKAQRPWALQDSLRCNSLSQFLEELVLFREAGAGDGGHPGAVRAGEARGWRTRAGALLFCSRNQEPLACPCCRVRTGLTEEPPASEQGTVAAHSLASLRQHPGPHGNQLGNALFPLPR